MKLPHPSAGIGAESDGTIDRLSLAIVEVAHFSTSIQVSRAAFAHYRSARILPCEHFLRAAPQSIRSAL